MNDLILKGGFVRVGKYKVTDHASKGEAVHHKSIVLSKLTRLEGPVVQYVNAEGQVLLVPEGL